MTTVYEIEASKTPSFVFCNSVLQTQTRKRANASACLQFILHPLRANTYCLSTYISNLTSITHIYIYIYIVLLAMDGMQPARGSGSDPLRRSGQPNKPGEGVSKKAKARRRHRERQEAAASEALGMSAALPLVFSAYTSFSNRSRRATRTTSEKRRKKSS
jgi:hypothetical protein